MDLDSSEGSHVFNSHRLSRSLPGLNGSIPQTTELVILDASSNRRGRLNKLNYTSVLGKIYIWFFLDRKIFLFIYFYMESTFCNCQAVAHSILIFYRSSISIFVWFTERNIFRFWLICIFYSQGVCDFIEVWVR